MYKAFFACLAMALGCAPLGVVIMLRRLTLIGDALAHGMLPGIAIGWVLGDGSPGYMLAGACLVGIFIFVASHMLGTRRFQTEDSGFASFHLLAVALGVLIISTQASSTALLHILFGQLMSVGALHLWILWSAAVFGAAFVFLFAPFVLLSIADAGYFRRLGPIAILGQVVFAVLVVVNLSASFQAVGTLLAVGMMMLPAIAARQWVVAFMPLVFLAIGLSVLSSWVGLLFSWHLDWPAGVSVVLVLGVVWVISQIFGRQSGLLMSLWRRPHLRG